MFIAWAVLVLDGRRFYTALKFILLTQTYTFISKFFTFIFT